LSITQETCVAHNDGIVVSNAKEGRKWPWNSLVCEHFVPGWGGEEKTTKNSRPKNTKWNINFQKETH